MTGTTQRTQHETPLSYAPTDPHHESQFLETIFENSHFLIACLDPQFNFLKVNRAYAEAGAKEPNFFIGKNHFELFPNLENEVAFRNVVASGEARVELAKPFRYEQFPQRGATYWDWRLSPIKNSGGDVTALILTLSDVTERIKTIKALRDSEHRFRATFEYAAVGIAHIAPSGRWLRANGKFCDIVGYSCEELLQHRFQDITHPDDLSADVDFFKQALYGELAVSWKEKRFINKRGESVWIKLKLSQVADKRGTVKYLIAVVEDITSRRIAEKEMAWLTHAIEQTAGSIIITDATGIIEYINPGFEKITGFSAHDAVGKTPAILKSGKQDDYFYASMWRAILSGEVFSDVLINRKKDGTLYYEEITITPLKDEHNKIISFICNGNDITERMQTQERLHYLAYHDLLTGLPNRVSLQERLSQAIRRRERSQGRIAILFFDVDRFKNINDSLGHDWGDQLLQQLAQRMAKCLRPPDMLAHLNGDEFAIVLEDIHSPHDVHPIVERIFQALKQPFALGNVDYHVTVSIGISLCPEDGCTPLTLLKNADLALCRAKEHGRNSFAFYSEELSTRSYERLTLEANLRSALLHSDLEVYYQPIVELSTNQINGMEALSRWTHEELGVISPDRFIPIAEETGLIESLSEFVMLSACSQWHIKRDRINRALRLSINISCRQFYRNSLLTLVDDMLAKTGFDPSRLTLEITESALFTDTEHAAKTLRELKTRGFQIALDDFGTGYSSLTYLRRFPIDVLKIDKSFVHDITTDSDDLALVSATIAMAHRLNITVVAEGVEQPEQLEILREEGCDYAQGFLFSPPLAHHNIVKYLDDQRGTVAVSP